MKAVMLSPFPQELTALISWGKLHKEKKCHSIFGRVGKTSHGAGTLALNTNHTLDLTAEQNWKDILHSQGQGSKVGTQKLVCTRCSAFQSPADWGSRDKQYFIRISPL